MYAYMIVHTCRIWRRHMPLQKNNLTGVDFRSGSKTKIRVYVTVKIKSNNLESKQSCRLVTGSDRIRRKRTYCDDRHRWPRHVRPRVCGGSESQYHHLPSTFLKKHPSSRSNRWSTQLVGRKGSSSRRAAGVASPPASPGRAFAAGPTRAPAPPVGQSVPQSRAGRAPLATGPGPGPR